MKSQRDDLKYLLALNKLPGIGKKRFMSLVEHYSEGKRIWGLSKKELLSVPGFTERICDSMIEQRNLVDPNEVISEIDEKGINVVTVFDDDYPFLLKNIYDPPPIIYFKGELPSCPDSISIAVVGSRKPTQYGRYVAEKISKQMALEGITVVSGMAIGVDTFAHKGALSGKGETIAVLGSGLDVPYPKRNIGLMNEIAKNGAVISEFPLGTQPLPAHFPMRNRIISGLSLGILVVEAGARSGALITADCALEHGREVFAIPGNITSVNSKGTNRLIKQGAKLVDCLDDILEEFWLIKKDYLNNDKPNDDNNGDLSEDEQMIMQNITGQRITTDYIVNKTGFSPKKVNLILAKLELKGKIKQLPGDTILKEK
ncbi:MAG TPA: DNA-protecting protein DprA [Thermoanaerobacterales bacterium]|nr:DNA-protecting protein DprA [Thermoanaerobacterales bacterium]